MHMWQRFACTVGVAVVFAAGAMAQSAWLNEILVNPPGSDDGQEFIELRTDEPGASLDGLTIVIVEADGGVSGNAGTIDAALDLSGFFTGDNGLFLWRDSGTVLQPPPEADTVVHVADFDPDIENGGNAYFLVTGFTGTVGVDYDADNDGTFDSIPWDTVVDAVEFPDDDTASPDYVTAFGGTYFPQQTWVADALYRVIDCDLLLPYAWVAGDVEGTAPGPYTWDATKVYGWDAVGVPNPEDRTLDPGGRNFEFGCNGACCLPGGFCVETTESDCIDLQGSFEGIGTFCQQGLCPGIPSACCLEDGSCVEVTEGDCVDYLGGTFQGDGVSCAEADCPQPTGACCVSGPCSEVTEADCLAAGGVFLGEFVLCNVFTCDGPGEVFLAEILVNPQGEDQGSEWIEIQGPPSMSLDGWWLFVMDNDIPNPAGTVDHLIDLSAYSTGSNGLLLIRDDDTIMLVPEPAPETNVVVFDFDPNIENGGTTFGLAHGNPSFAAGDDLDVDNDGVLDFYMPGFTAMDSVSYVDGDEDGLVYADDLGGVVIPRQFVGNEGWTPDAIYRVLTCDGSGPYLWTGGDIEGGFGSEWYFDAAENFGWDEVGVEDPSQRFLDGGLLNFQYCDELNPGDMDCDGDVDFDDIAFFVEALSGEANWPYEDCPWLNGDVNGDDNVTFDDIAPFVSLIGA